MKSHDLFDRERRGKCVDDAARTERPARRLDLDLASAVIHGAYVGAQSHVAARAIGRNQRAIAPAHSPVHASFEITLDVVH